MKSRCWCRTRGDIICIRTHLKWILFHWQNIFISMHLDFGIQFIIICWKSVWVWKPPFSCIYSSVNQIEMCNLMPSNDLNLDTQFFDTLSKRNPLESRIKSKCNGNYTAFYRRILFTAHRNFMNTQWCLSLR